MSFSPLVRLVLIERCVRSYFKLWQSTGDLELSCSNSNSEIAWKLSGRFRW